MTLRPRAQLCLGELEGAYQKFVSMMPAFVFYCCHKNCCNHRGSKQHTFTSSQSCVRRPGELGWSVHSSCHGAKGKVSDWVLLWRNWGGICSHVPPSCWQHSILCGYRAAFLFPSWGSREPLSAHSDHGHSLSFCPSIFKASNGTTSPSHARISLTSSFDPVLLSPLRETSLLLRVHVTRLGSPK